MRYLKIAWFVIAGGLAIPAAVLAFAMLYGTVLYVAIALGLEALLAWGCYEKGRLRGRSEAREEPHRSLAMSRSYERLYGPRMP